jgi:hypothetical protein
MSLKLKLLGTTGDLLELKKIVESDSRGKSKWNHMRRFTIAIKAEGSREVGNQDSFRKDARVEVSYYNPENLPIFWRLIPARITNSIYGLIGGLFMIDSYKFRGKWKEISAPSMSNEDKAKVREDLWEEAEHAVSALNGLGIPVGEIIVPANI